MSLVEMMLNALRMFSFAPGLGLVTMLHWLPSQCSTSVCLGLVSFVDVSPTAQMSFAETTCTLFRMLLAKPTGLGVLTTLHRLPSQCSARVFSWPSLK